MEKLKKSHGVTVAWRSFELRPKDAPPPPAEYLAKVKASRPRLYAIAKEQYGLDLNPGPFGIDSRPALVGAKYAEAQNVGDAYHEAIFKAYWLAGRNIEDRAVLTNVATAIGLDAEAFLAALETETYQSAMVSDIAQAQAYGLHAVPALIFVDKYLVSGAQPYEILCQVVEKIEAGDVN